MYAGLALFANYAIYLHKAPGFKPHAIKPEKPILMNIQLQQIPSETKPKTTALCATHPKLWAGV